MASHILIRALAGDTKRQVPAPFPIRKPSECAFRVDAQSDDPCSPGGSCPCPAGPADCARRG